MSIVTVSGFSEDSNMSVEGRKVLVVDDWDDNRDIIYELLSDENVDVRTARNGPEALSMVRDFQPDVVLLDVKMPGMNGMQVLEKLNVHGNHYEVIMMTGHENIDDACKAMELGAFSYVRKPIMLEQLLEQITNALVKVDETRGHLLKEKTYKEELKKYSDMLKETFDIAEFQSKRFDLILNNLNEPFLAIDCDTIVMMLNNAAEETFNVNVAQSIGCEVRQVFSDKAFVTSLLKLIGTANTTDDASIFKVISFKEFFFNASISKLINVAGVLTGYMIVFNDITDSFRAEYIRNSFLQYIAHEIGAPLSSIKNSSALLATDNGMSGASRTRLSDLGNSCQRIGRLVNTITRFTRTMSTTAQVQPESLDVIEFSETIVEGYRKPAADKGVTIVFKHELVDGIVVTDRDLLSTVIDGVLDNAMKYSPSDGTVTFTITDSENDENDFMTIAIVDNGPGIDLHQLDSLFEWFRQGDDPTTQAYGGAGLGLPLAQRACMLLGGEIEINSGVTAGVHCCIRLPKRS